MLKINGAPDPRTIHTFKKHWPNVKPVVTKLIRNESIDRSEWQNLFHDVHMICSWDSKGPYKLLKNLEFELRDSYVTRIQARLKSIEDGQQQLKEYIDCWCDFNQHCERFPKAFQQLDLATRGIITRLRSNSPKENGLHKAYSLQLYTIKSYKTNCDSTVRFLMLKLWNEHIVKQLEKRLQSSANDLVWSERNGFIVDSQLIVGLRESFSQLKELSVINHHNEYLDNFKGAYVESIDMYYASKADEVFHERGLAEYIKWAISRLDREEQKAELYLNTNADAIQKVTDTCTRVLVENFVDQILHVASCLMFEQNFENMKLIFKFLDRLEGVGDKLLKLLRHHIVSIGLEDLTNSSALIGNNPDKFVEKLLDIHNRYSRVISTSFENDPRAQKVLDKAFGLIVNDTRIFDTQADLNSENNTPTKAMTKNTTQPESRCSELLANYCNLLFRKSAFSKKLTTKELSDRLNEVLLIIKLLKNKDSFLKFHKLHLMKRLILDASISYDKEEEFVNSLKDIAGLTVEQVNELLRMFKDLKSSESLNMKYLKTLEENNNNTISNLTTQVTNSLIIQDNNNKPSKHNDLINIRILNPSAWTKVNEQSQKICLSSEVEDLLPGFEKFYKSQYEGRELEWCHHLSNGIVTFTNDFDGKFDLEVTAAQLAILSAFNDSPRDTKILRELEVLSKLNPLELRRTLWSLVSNPKLRTQIIICEPQLNCMKDMDNELNLYRINHEFALVKNGRTQTKGRVCLIGRFQL